MNVNEESNKMIDNLKYEIDDKIRDVYKKIDSEIKELKEIFYVWDELSDFTLPFTYKKRFKTLQNNISKSKIPIVVNEYQNKIQTENEKLRKDGKNREKDKDILKTYDIKNLEESNELEKISVRNTTFLKNAKIFSDASKNLNWDTKPLIAYYSASQLFSFFINTVFLFEEQKLHHGIKIETQGESTNIQIKYTNYGFFERIVKTFSIMLDSSIFSDCYIYSEFGSEDLIFLENTNKLSIKKDLFSLNTLIDDSSKSKIESFLGELVLEMGYTEYYNREYFVKNSIILKNYILIFIACNLARYNPYLWKKICEGTKTDLFLHIQDAIESIDDMVKYISERFKNWKKNPLREIR